MDSMANGGRTPAGMRVSGAVCLVIVALAPIAVGGFRPQWWLVFACAIFLAAAACAITIATSRRRIRFLTHAAPGVVPVYILFLLGLSAHVLLVRGTASDADALYGLLRHLSFAALGWTLLQCMTRDQRAISYAQVLIAAFLAYAVYGLITIDRTEWLLFAKTQYDGFATGPFLNRNSFATFLAMGMNLALACALADETGVSRHHRRGHRVSPLEGKMRSLLLAAVALLCLAIIFATASRMGLFVALAGASVVVALRLRRIAGQRGVIRVIVFAAGMLFFLALAMIALLYGGGVAERLGSTADNANVRLDLYRNVLEMIAANPLLGVGLDNFGEAFRAYQRLPVSPDRDWNLAHNTYLALWAELGLALGSMPILLCALIAVALLRRSLSGNVTPVSHLSDAALAAIAIGALHSLVDFSLEMPANAYLLIALIVLGLSPTAPRGQAQGDP